MQEAPQSSGVSRIILEDNDTWGSINYNDKILWSSCWSMLKEEQFEWKSSTGMESSESIFMSLAYTMLF